MNLALFDIDGTLTQTNEVDGRCFEQALADTFEITGINSDWASYSHTTDSAILADLFRARLGRAHQPNDVLDFCNCFVRLLRESLATEPASFSEIPGASKMLVRLSREPGWAIAIATGGWRESAALKLQAVGLSLDDFPHASAEDGHSREQIIQSATTRALARYRQHEFGRTVSIGDAVWDLRTAVNLGLAFIGITGEGTASALRQAGATNLLADFQDYDAFLECLNRTAIRSEPVSV